jgi:hypothetical protein
VEELLPDYFPSGLLRLTAEKEAIKQFKNDLDSKELTGG